MLLRLRKTSYLFKELLKTGKPRRFSLRTHLGGEPTYSKGSRVRQIGPLRESILKMGAAVRDALAERERRLIAETKQKEAETARQQIANILESMSDGFCAFDPEWRFAYINEKAERELARQNFRREDLLGKVLWEFFPEQVGTRWHDAVQQAMGQRIPITCEFYYSPLDEWYEDRVSPTPDGGVGIYRHNITERKRAERAVIEQQHLLDLSTEAILVLDEQRRITYWNKGAEEDYGYTREEALGRVAHDLMQTKFPEPLERITEKLHHDGRWSGELIHTRKDGLKIVVASRWALDRNAQGNPASILETNRDITARKRAQQSLEQAARHKETLYQFVERRHRARSPAEMYEAALGAILSALPCERASILLSDETGILRFVASCGLSEAYCKAVEGHSPWKPGEANPTPVDIPAVNTAKLDESLKAVITHEGIEALAFIPLLVNGSLAGKFMVYYDEPHVFTEEELELSLTIARQLALGIEHAQANKKLTESEQRFRVAQELSLDAFTILSAVRDDSGAIADFRWEYVNPSAGRILRRTPETLVGQRLLEVLPGNKNDSDLFQRYLRVVETGEAHDYELRYDSDGIHGWFRNMTVKLGDGVAVYFSDITERKQREDELESFNEDLERRVADRTREFQEANAALLRQMEEQKQLEAQLLQAQKMESMGTLAGGVAHDFNNILNIIQAYASIIGERGDRNKEIQESVTVINETVERGSAVVQELLTVARKSRSSDLESVNVNNLVEGLLSLIRETFPKTIELSYAREPDLPPIWADKNQIEQVLLNLCVNARDAMSAGGQLIFKTQAIDGASLQHLGDAEGRYALIEVTDTGTGMDDNVRKRIFEPFFTTKSRDQGTGLGLSVVYGIVRSHNGFIDVESQPLSGTTFRLYFPFAPAEVTVKEPVPKIGACATTVSDPTATVLIVEDEQNMLHLLEKILLQRGYKVLKASDGETAIDTFKRCKEAIDVVLLDMGLPKIAGHEVLLQIKNENPDVKVIIASGYPEPELKSEIEWSQVKLLPKPYTPHQMLNTLQSVIQSEI